MLFSIKGFNLDDAESASTEQKQAIPMNRYGESEDIANLALFLTANESSFISGSEYRIDGGMAAQ
ncbi:SDR family oxidoreductase [Marinococcus luteus]|uniref:SDR family oxidoreductase n=1 Tax=Marinococcus luteus TaxID=1122204 RepID=UPI000B8099A9|nr:SDR family oxidoreductase [Marinococcus luteus]